ncbi:MAG TPA: hypothetical protein VGO43_15205, partial [Pyrinomonadaceae bacterium]|nr:hypothetical protein [Pyrinomonadaceae bacterium]
AWLRSLAVLACLTAEHLLAEINNYMIDLLVLPLLLEATWMIICPSSDGKTVGLKEVVRFFLLMGMSVGLKLTNLTFAGPLCLLFAYSWISTEPASPRPPISKSLVAATAAFAAPIIPWTFYLWYRTGSPIFPLYNEIFRSPHWQLVNFFDGRWGPKGVIETLLWPLAVVFTPERLSELNFYSGRMLLGWVVALSSLVFVRKDPALKAMCGLTLGCGFLWSVSTGYIRYGLYLELLAGILTVACLAILIKSTDVRWQQSVRYAVAGVVLIALVTQCYFAAAWSFDHEWGGRPNCIRQRGCKNEFVQFFSDRTISQYETDEEYQLFANIDVWVETAPKTSAMMVMLRSDIPGLTYFPAFYEAPASRSSVAASLERLRGKRFFSLVVDDESGKSDSAKTLKMLGFTVKKVTSVKIPYFSRENTIPMLLIELQPPPNNELP